jgi:magnesium-transporting ATPase (P-type)
MGLRAVLLTGDAQAIALAVGKRLGLDEVHAELLPDEKVAKVTALRAVGRRVAMVGDGINDAPALAEANVGVAMGSGPGRGPCERRRGAAGNNLPEFVEMAQIARRLIIWSESTAERAGYRTSRPSARGAAGTKHGLPNARPG